MINVTFGSAHHRHIQAPSSSVRLPHDYIINTVPLVGFRMLPCLLIDVTFIKPSVRYCCLINGQERQQLSSSFIEFTVAMRASLIPPFITCTPGPHACIQVGSIETARQGCDVSVSDERKIDQVVSELDRYQVVVGALQSAGWFGSKEYKVGDTVV